METLHTNDFLRLWNLELTGVEDAHCADLAQFLWNKDSLRALHVGKNRISDKRWATIANAQSVNSSLHDLDLGKVDVQQANCKVWMKALLSSSSLRTLGSGNDDVVTNALQATFSNFPFLTRKASVSEETCRRSVSEAAARGTDGTRLPIQILSRKALPHPVATKGRKRLQGYDEALWGPYTAMNVPSHSHEGGFGEMYGCIRKRVARGSWIDEFVRTARARHSSRGLPSRSSRQAHATCKGLDHGQQEGARKEEEKCVGEQVGAARSGQASDADHGSACAGPLGLKR